MSFDRTRHTAGWVAAAYRARTGDEALAPERLETGIRQLEALRDPSADELEALAFLHYAAAEAAMAHADRSAWQRELAEGLTAARQGLAHSPARADLAVALAEAEFLLDGPAPGVYAALDLSYRTAPRDMWIVQRRIGLGLRLIAVAPPDIAEHVISDVRILGAPFANAEQYQILAQAAFSAGPVAITTVERELGLGHPWPFGFFEKDLSELRAPQAAQLRAR